MELIVGKENKIMTDDNDKKTAEYNAGFQNGRIYSNSSPETLKLFSELKNENTQLFGLVQSIHETIHSEFGIMAILKDIKEQTCKTNGRVNKLEFWQAGVIAIGTLFSVVIPSVAWYYIYKFDTLKNDVTIHIAQDIEMFNQIKK
jgi:hypothetical protein